jgi:hypothetical protein
VWRSVGRAGAFPFENNNNTMGGYGVFCAFTF